MHHIKKSHLKNAKQNCCFFFIFALVYVLSTFYNDYLVTFKHTKVYTFRVTDGIIMRNDPEYSVACFSEVSTFKDTNNIATPSNLENIYINTIYMYSIILLFQT